MRNAFVESLIEIARQDSKLVLLMAEVGYGVVEPFEKKYPKRFYNTGISEQSLVLNAAGMAIKGMHPVAYSMSSFLPSRAFEMIKDSVCYQNLPVVLVGIGSGISYGELGSTHHAIEEIALMRSLPNMTVILPADGDDCKSAIKYAVELEKPVYVGLEKVISKAENGIKPFSTNWHKEGDGSDGSIIACGTMYNTALAVIEQLKLKGIKMAAYRANIVKPIDYQAIDEAVNSEVIYVLDEHVSAGGVGEAISTYILENKKFSKIKRFEIISIPDEFPNKVYSRNDLLLRYGLVTDSIVKRIENGFFRA